MLGGGWPKLAWGAPVRPVALMNPMQREAYTSGFRDGGKAAIVQVRDIAKHHPLTTRADLVEAIVAAIEAATQAKP